MKIGEDAFKGCPGLTEITLYGELLSIADSAFDNCNQLNKIWIYSNDEAEFERIKRLVPAALQDKCETHPLCKETEGMRKTAIIEPEARAALTAGGLFARHAPSGEAPEDCARSFKG